MKLSRKQFFALLFGVSAAPALAKGNPLAEMDRRWRSCIRQSDRETIRAVIQEYDPAGSISLTVAGVT